MPITDLHKQVAAIALQAASPGEAVAALLDFARHSVGRLAERSLPPS